MLVDHDGQSITLDASGNAQAAEIVRNAKKGSLVHVTITGQEDQMGTVKVESMTAIR